MITTEEINGRKCTVMRSDYGQYRNIDELIRHIEKLDPCKYNSAEMKWEIIRIIKGMTDDGTDMR